MPIRIFNNLSSLVTQRALGANNGRIRESIERIASGIRVNRASDDAASFVISESLRSDARILRQGSKNVNAAVSLVATAEGALNEIASSLLRLKELAQQASTGTIGHAERDAIQLEFNQLKKEIDRIANETEFNGKKLIDGTLAASANDHKVIVVGLNSETANLLNLNTEIDLTASDTTGLGINAVSVSKRENAILALRDIDDSINELSMMRSRVGVTQGRLIHALSNLNVNAMNLTNAGSVIRDADLGLEFASLTRNQILVQSSAAMVGQSNLMPRSVLQLLQ